MMNYLKSMAVATLALGLMACPQKEDPILCSEALSFGSGAWVSNEGGFGNNNASLTFIGDNGVTTQNTFLTVNEQVLGDVGQHVFVSGGLGYVALNGSQKLEVFDVTDGGRVFSITGFDYPHQFAADENGTVYISNGSGSGDVSAIDPETGNVLWSTMVGLGPEHMAVSGNYLAVCNSGGWDTDNTVSIIDLNSQNVVETLTVGDRPTDIEVDGDGDFWVLCKGETLFDEAWQIIGDTPAELWEIDGQDFTTDIVYPLGVEGDHPDRLAQNSSGELFVNVNGILVLDPNTGNISSLVDGTFYSLDVDPVTDHVWAAPYPDFQSAGEMEVYDQSGALLQSHATGIAPNGVHFVQE